MVKRKELDLSPARRRQPGVNLGGLAAALVLFACVVALGHWSSARTGAAANPVASKDAAAKPAVSKPVAVSNPAPAEVLTLAQPLEQETLIETEPAPESEPAAASEPALKREPVARRKPAPAPARSTPARPASVYNNDVFTPPPAAAKPAPAAVSHPTPASTPAPPAMSVKPPAQNNPAMKPSSSKPKASDTSLPDKVVRVAPPKTPGAAEPFYSVRLNKADSKYLADVVADTLKQHGFDDSRVVPSSDGKYTVTVGEYNFRYAAENAKKQLKDLGFSETFIEEKTVAE